MVLVALAISMVGMGGCLRQSEVAFRSGAYADEVTLWMSGAFLGFFGVLCSVVLILFG